MAALPIPPLPKAGLHGSDAPDLYASGHIEELLIYAAMDCEATLAA